MSTTEAAEIQPTELSPGSAHTRGMIHDDPEIQLQNRSAGAAELWAELGEALQRAGAAASKIASAGAPPTKPPPKYLKTLDAAQALGVTMRTLTRYGDQGAPCVRLKGGRRRWDVEQVKQWLDEGGGA